MFILSAIASSFLLAFTWEWTVTIVGAEVRFAEYVTCKLSV